MNPKEYLIYILPKTLGYRASMHGLLRPRNPITLTYSVTAACQSRCKTCNIGLKYQQDPIGWISEAKIDHPIPMFYEYSDSTWQRQTRDWKSFFDYQGLSEENTSLGLGWYYDETYLDPDNVVRKINYARSLGLRNFSIFQLTGDYHADDEPLIQVLTQGAEAPFADPVPSCFSSQQTPSPTPPPTPSLTPTPNPTSTPTLIPSEYDLDNDGDVDQDDLILLLSRYGPSDSLPPADFNNDELINGLDYGAFLII